MPPAQRDLAVRSIQIGRQILEITVSSPAYREGMKYGSSSVTLPRVYPQIDSDIQQRFTTPTRLQRFRLRSCCGFLGSCEFWTWAYRHPSTNASCSPDQCNLHEIRTAVEQLAALLAEGMCSLSIPS